MAVRNLLVASGWIGLVSVCLGCGGNTTEPSQSGAESGGESDFERSGDRGGSGGASNGGTTRNGGGGGATKTGSSSTAGTSGGAGAAASGGNAGKANTGGSSGGHTAGAAGTSGSGQAGGGAGSAPGGGSGMGGTKATGGGSGTSTGGAGSPGNAGSAGRPGSGGGAGSAGALESGGGAGSTGCRKDAEGLVLAKPGDETSTPSEYLNLGDLRLLNNRWGSGELNCNTPMKVFVKADGSVGWEFNRGVCDTSGKDGKSSGQHPDYPEIEFGIHPFGVGSSLETSPPFPSTNLLPLQIKDITSATVTVDGLSINLQNASSWNLNFELWLSQRNPITESDPGVYAELITFWGWQNGRWPCDTNLNASVSSGGKNYKLCHQSDSWGSSGPTWRYFQFWVDGGPNNSFSGKLDVKALLDWLVNGSYKYSPDLWVTRFEVGSEIDDNTSGTATLKNITFEVNNTSKSVELCK